MEQVWLTLSRQGGVGPVVKVVRDAASAYDHIERLAAECGVAGGGEDVDTGHDPATGRLVWFSTEDAEAHIEGPLEIEE